jgi:hypothetical protein
MGEVRRYYARADIRGRIGPTDLPGAIGVLSAPHDPLPVGIAYANGHVGGWANDQWLGPLEAVWRIVIGREELEGRWALRDGCFVELAEDAL